METEHLTALDALIDAGQAATPGEWSVGSGETDFPFLIRSVEEIVSGKHISWIAHPIACKPENYQEANATFIAFAKNALPDLIALRERVKGLEAVARAAVDYLDKSGEMPWAQGLVAKDRAVKEAREKLRDAALATLEGK